MPQISEFRSSIPKLDDALGVHLRRGQLILVAGLQGGGKTILAAQLSREFVVRSAEVLFLSTEVTPQALYKKNIAAVCSIPYDRIKDGMKTVTIPGEGGTQLDLPDPEVYGEDSVRKSYPIVHALAQRLTLGKFTPAGFDPRQEFDDILATYQEQKQKLPDVLVYDYLWYPKVERQDMDPYKMRGAVVDAAEALKALAGKHDMLVIVFCQVDPGLEERKKIDPSGLYDLKKVWHHADAFVGISQRLLDERTHDLANGLYESVQHLNVMTKASMAPVLVPVERAFEFQRFDSCRAQQKRKSEDDLDELDRRARVIEKASEFTGYVLARRRKFYDIFDIGCPHAINLYAFLLLAASNRSPKEGVSFYSRRKLTDALALSSKQVIAATDFLTEQNYVDVPPGIVRQSLRYRIEDWKVDQNPSMKGYFKLFRNLREARCADLMAEPATFRVWLRLLADARSFPDESLELEPGEVLLKREQMRETLMVSADQLDAVLERLQTRGSIVIKPGSPTKIIIPNWELYQTRVYGSSSANDDEGKVEERSGEPV